MIIRRLLLSFWITYAALFAAAASLALILHIEVDARIGSIAFILAIIIACYIFSRKTGRYLTSVERNYFLVGIVVIDTTLQALLLNIQLWLSDLPGARIPNWMSLVIIVYYVSMHAIFALAFIFFTRKLLERLGIIQASEAGARLNSTKVR